MTLRHPTSTRLRFFFNDTATTEIYTLSLHDALPISGRDAQLSQGVGRAPVGARVNVASGVEAHLAPRLLQPDRKSTRLNSSHANISYAVFCLKKKNQSNNRAGQLT